MWAIIRHRRLASRKNLSKTKYDLLTKDVPRNGLVLVRSGFVKRPETAPKLSWVALADLFRYLDVFGGIPLNVTAQAIRC